MESTRPEDIERNVRQLLADKISGNMVGIWLLVPEFLRLGVWDLACVWSGDRTGRSVDPRLAMHIINEAALCFNVRARHGLSQKGFELVNGLPFIPADTEIHRLLNAHNMSDAWSLQKTLGRLRRASGHYDGSLLAIDPHHMRSFTRRQTRRHRRDIGERAVKTSQSIFIIDAKTKMPVCSALVSSSCSVSQTTSALLETAAAILPMSSTTRPLVLADGEYFVASLMPRAYDLGFDMLVPMPNSKSCNQLMASLPDEKFQRRWPGYATCSMTYRFQKSQEREYFMLVQREGEQKDAYVYSGFLCTSPRDEVKALCEDFPDRWHIEEFFNLDQGLGWKKAGTLNLNIRYNHLSLAMITQAAIHQLRTKLPEPYKTWNAQSLADHFFNGIDGDIRVHNDTIVVTFYNAPNSVEWKNKYQNLPAILQNEHIKPNIPWLYNFKLDFRFK